jgi:hypothetical protein
MDILNSFIGTEEEFVPDKCIGYNLSSKKAIIKYIIKMVLKDNNLFDRKDILGDYLFNCHEFMNMLLPEEQDKLNQYLRDNMPTTTDIIVFLGPIRFFKKFAEFVGKMEIFRNEMREDPDIYTKFKFFLNKYLSKFNNTYLCTIVEILLHGLGKCDLIPKEHTIILVNKNSPRVNIIKQKQSLGAPITTSDIELVEEDKIMEIKLNPDNDKYAQMSVDKVIHTATINKNIYDKALDNREFIMENIISVSNIKNQIDNMDRNNLKTLKRIFNSDFNTDDQFESLMINIAQYLYGAITGIPPPPLIPDTEQPGIVGTIIGMMTSTGAREFGKIKTVAKTCSKKSCKKKKTKKQ